MKIWLDKKNPAPKEYLWARNVHDAIGFISNPKLSDSESVVIVNVVCGNEEYPDLMSWLDESNKKYELLFHEDVGPAELYKRHEAKKENHLNDIPAKKRKSTSNKEKTLKEVYRRDGGEWVLVISI